MINKVDDTGELRAQNLNFKIMTPSDASGIQRSIERVYLARSLMLPYVLKLQNIKENLFDLIKEELTDNYPNAQEVSGLYSFNSLQTNKMYTVYTKDYYAALSTNELSNSYLVNTAVLTVTNKIAVQGDDLASLELIKRSMFKEENINPNDALLDQSLLEKFDSLSHLEKMYSSFKNTVKDTEKEFTQFLNESLYAFDNNVVSAQEQKEFEFKLFLDLVVFLFDLTEVESILNLSFYVFSSKYGLDRTDITQLLVDKKQNTYEYSILKDIENNQKVLDFKSRVNKFNNKLRVFNTLCDSF